MVGVCGHVEPLGSRDGGAGPTGEGAEDESVEGDGAQGGDGAGGSDGSGAGGGGSTGPGGAPGGVDDTCCRICQDNYSQCQSLAAYIYVTDMKQAQAELMACKGDVDWWQVVGVAGACAACAGGNLPACWICGGAVGGYAALYAWCEHQYEVAARTHLNAYLQRLDGCEQQWIDDGCDECCGLIVVPF